MLLERLKIYFQNVKSKIMSGQYVIVICAFVLAQLLMTSIVVYRYQKDKDITYNKALITYLKAETGFFIIGLIGVISVCFILSDWIDLSLTKKDLLSIEHRTLKENLQLYFKTSAFVLGGFIQYIAFVWRDKGKIAIDKIVQEKVGV